MSSSSPASSASPAPSASARASASRSVEPVVIVGAGLAGLACALALHRRGVPSVVLEASDGVGGRVRTDEVDGFRLDRGFQILLTAYPEAEAVLDYERLDLRRFDPGASIALGDRFAVVGDPLRRPADLWATMRAPVGSLADKVRVLALVASVRRGRAADLLRRPDQSTAARIAQAGFSTEFVERFLRPLFAGIQLDPDLEVSSRRFEIILRMLAVGDAAVPNLGMGQISAQLAGGLDEEQIRLGAEVASIDGPTALLTTGERVPGRVLVVATEGPVAARLLGLPDPGSRAVACGWFAADEPPLAGRRLVLDGTGLGPVRNLAVLSEVAPGYAPPGRTLIAAAVPGPGAFADDLADAARRQLRGWFGATVDRWELLRLDRIRHGQPDQVPPWHPKQAVALGGGVFVCGDHRDSASIQGALYSGRRTAQAVIAHLDGPAGRGDPT